MTDETRKDFPFNNILFKNRDSISNTILVAALVSLVCAVLVSATAVLLKSKQAANRLYYGEYKNIVQLLESIEPGTDIDDMLSRLQIKFVDLDSGNYVEGLDSASFDVLAAARDPEQSTTIPAELDVAGLGQRANVAKVYLLLTPVLPEQVLPEQVLTENALSENETTKDEPTHDARIQYIILPIYGQGMWSTIRGYLALRNDANTIAGIIFYEHGETPGVGDRIQDPAWLSLWRGKQIYDGGYPAIRVSKRHSDSHYVVDNITGATISSQSVVNMILYWLDEHGYQPFLKKLTESEG